MQDYYMSEHNAQLRVADWQRAAKQASQVSEARRKSESKKGNLVFRLFRQRRQSPNNK